MKKASQYQVAIVPPMTAARNSLLAAVHKLPPRGIALAHRHHAEELVRELEYQLSDFDDNDSGYTPREAKIALAKIEQAMTHLRLIADVVRMEGGAL